MRGLIRRVQADRERGSVATIVAVLFSGMVIIGMLAVSVDLGNLTYERRQLQNSADATSLALARVCAEAPAQCKKSTAQDLLGANSRDGVSRYDTTRADGGACARISVGELAKCTGSGSNVDLAQCPPVPSWLGADVNYVETYSATETGDGETELFLPFSRVLTGDASGDKGTMACARAAWGSPSKTGPTLPITIGACDWANKTSVGGVPGKKYAPSPPYSPAGNLSTQPPVPTVIKDGGYATGIFLNADDANKCTGNPGHAFPGGFGWLPNENCVADVSDGWIVGGTGAKYGCREDDWKKYVGTEVLIPIHDEVKDKDKEYHISGVASFYLAGWVSMPKGGKSGAIYQQPDEVCTGHFCDTGKTVYIWGWFTSDIRPATGGGLSNGPDRGVSVIVPAG